MGQKTQLLPEFHSVLRRLGAMLLAFSFPSAYGPSARYRPEDHYVRGPGPKWHAKHLAQPVAPAHPVTQSVEGRNAHLRRQLDERLG